MVKKQLQMMQEIGGTRENKSRLTKKLIRNIISHVFDRIRTKTISRVEKWYYWYL